MCEVGFACTSGIKTACDGNGQYADELDLSACKTAPAGAKPTSDRHGVESCPAGKFSTGGEDECSECGSDKTSNAGAAGCRTCATCGTGKYKISDCSPGTETQCSDCPKNTFTISGASDINGCEDCANGGHSQPGSGYCENCLTGTYFDEDDNECKACPQGKFSDTGANTVEICKPCDDGFISDNPFGAGFCSPCPAGFFANPAQTACLPSSPGTISGIAAKNCDACEKGKFAIGFNNTGCKFCDDKDILKGSTTANTSSTSASSCVCEQTDFESDSTGTCEAVSKGVKSSVGGMNVETLDLEPGFWRTSSSSTKVLPCLNPKHCKGGADTADLCADGHTGPLCAVQRDLRFVPLHDIPNTPVSQHSDLLHLRVQRV
ncbi:hypothetical protein TrST_g3602 [Triparma strigata]|uniref:Tyrosine-protein kinase ephrin type A/B receptor-like domain-containing protein n=1 Tax=Triparma strigata TaxID=1606541 RepID=A0A9W7B7F8_9STRA|nr:hypothetical protein TrST_g3602 [Triparma strigata]